MTTDNDDNKENAQDEWISFADLKREKIVRNHVTLNRWKANEGFPAGVLLGPNTRRWRRSWINKWLASRPTERGGRP
jgi:hypothetical protein